MMYRFAFQEINDDTKEIWFCLDYFSDTIYILDIAFNFHTGYLEDGVLQTDPSKLKKHYTNTTTFYIDCLCLLPLDFLYISVGYKSLLRVFRLVKIYKFWHFLDRTERHTNFPNLFRSIILIHYLLVIFHWNACIFYLIAQSENGDASTSVLKQWIQPNFTTCTPIDNQICQDLVRSDDVILPYLKSFYWCTLVLTTIGETNLSLMFIFCSHNCG